MPFTIDKSISLDCLQIIKAKHSYTVRNHYTNGTEMLVGILWTFRKQQTTKHQIIRLLYE